MASLLDRVGAGSPGVFFTRINTETMPESGYLINFR
jgi:hypothetical protein